MIDDLKGELARHAGPDKHIVHFQAHPNAIGTGDLTFFFWR